MIGPGGKLHEQDRLATGNPTYGGGSNAATFGTVDPTGYVERSRRSGLARSILAGGQAGNGKQPAAGSIDPAMLGETASRVDRGAVIRTLAARLAAGRQGG